MNDVASKLPIKREQAQPSLRPIESSSFESLRREMERLFDDFGHGLLRPFRQSMFSTEPFYRRVLSWPSMPAIDVSESDKSIEITAELPGIDEKHVEVKVSNGTLIIKGEKQETKEEKKKDYYLSERKFGSFERSFEVPQIVDTDKIDATFNKGVLTITLPKKAEAQKPEKMIEVKAA